MRRGFVVLAVAVVALLAAAELWLRARGEPRPPSAATSPGLASPDVPRAAPLLVVGGSFTAAEGLSDEARWTGRLATRIVGRAGFSDVVVGAPLAEPGPGLLATIEALARKSEPPHARALNVVAHDHGADVVVFEVGGDALGGDPAPFVIAAVPPEAAALPTPDRRRPLALLDWFDRWSAARGVEGDERAVDRLVASDGFLAGAKENARRRLEEVTAAVKSRHPDDAQLRFLRALILELHGLHRIEVRQHAIAEWRKIFGALRLEQRSTVIVLAGPSLMQVALDQVALALAIPVVHAPPFDLDPRLRIGGANGRPAAAVHAEVADAVWAALTKRGILPPTMEAPADVAETAERIDAAARARAGTDQALITLAHDWLAERCEFGATPPPEALFGVGAHGRLAPDVAAEVVLKRPALPEELVVAASVKAGTGAPPRLKVRHANGELLLEPKTTAAPSGKAGDRIALEYRVAAPKSKDVLAWPAFELTVILAAGAADPEFELAAVELTHPR